MPETTSGAPTSPEPADTSGGSDAPPGIGRRRFLRDGAALLGVGLAGGPLLAACSADVAPTGTSGTTAAGSGTTLGTTVGSTPGTAVPAGAIDELRRTLRGTVLVPGDPAYATTGLPANARYASIRPAVIAQCADEADVVTAVNWSRENGVAPMPRGGGHNYAGLSTTTGLLIDLGALHQVTVDQATGRATVMGAALNQDVYDAVHDGPLLLPGGTCLGVGVGGLVLGGGIGYNARWAGLTCDRLRATRMVTAAGEVVVADEQEHADLFWACRGATGGQFGIHTEFTFDLVEVPPSVAYYRFEWRGADDATAVLTAFDQLMADAPAALNAVAMAQAVPDTGAGPREAITVMSRGQFIGSRADLEALVQPLLDAAPNTTSRTIEEHPYWEAAKIFISAPDTESHSWGDLSRYADRTLPAEVWVRQVDLLAECPQRSKEANGALWSLGWVGGPVVNGVGRGDTAYVHRGVNHLIRPTTVWPADAPDAVADDLIAWSDSMIALLDGHTPRESYQNFPNRLIPDWAEQYYAENLPRLIEVKAAYDPDDLFTSEQGIPVR